MNPHSFLHNQAFRSLGIGVLLFLTEVSGGRAAPVDVPSQLEAQLPRAAPPAGMAVYQLPTGTTHRSTGFAFEGGSFSEQRDFAMAATLVKHPRGDLLIDTGFGRDIAALMPPIVRWTTSWERWTSASEQLDRAGYDRKHLRGILLTHAHWDHVSGISDFPGVPVLVTPEEKEFIATGGWLTATIRNMPGVTLATYSFEGGPYLGFPKHHDVYGDGSIVVVPAPGHTPGSVIIFLSLPTGTRYAMLGDLVYQLEGITLLKQRPWFLRIAEQENRDLVGAHISHIADISMRFPEMILVPAHDMRGFAHIRKM